MLESGCYTDKYMSERITLSYSINLNELGTETHRLYESVRTKMDALLMTPVALEDVLESKVCEDIDKLRQQMLDIDLCLADLSTIIIAYNHHRNQPPLPIEDPPQNALDDLGDKLKDFTHKISSS